MAKKIEVLLLKPLPPKGNAGDIIEVKIHYAQHVLIPQGIAVVYDKQAKNQRAAQDKKIAAFKADMLDRVKDMVTKLETSHGFNFEKQVNDAGSLYDSISTKSITQYVSETFGIKLGTENFQLEEKIDTLGDFEIAFSYEDITATFPIHVTAVV